MDFIWFHCTEFCSLSLKLHLAGTKKILSELYDPLGPTRASLEKRKAKHCSILAWRIP